MCRTAPGSTLNPALLIEIRHKKRRIMAEPEERDVEVIKVEYYLTTESSITLRSTRGFRPRSSLAQWEKVFTEYYGAKPNQRMAYQVTIRDKKTGEDYRMVLVFSGNVVKFGQEVLNGKLINTAPET